MADHAQREDLAPSIETTDTETGLSAPKVSVPPAQANIPAAPPGFVPMNGKDFFGVTPRTVHMAALPDVIDELVRSDDFAEVFGKTAPPRDLTLEIVQAAFLWSRQRAQMREWDLYCRTQEGLAWRELRALMRRVAPAYESATTTDSTVSARYAAPERTKGGRDAAHEAKGEGRPRRDRYGGAGAQVAKIVSFFALNARRTGAGWTRWAPKRSARPERAPRPPEGCA